MAGFPFSRSNPSGPGRGDVAALPRRVADTLGGPGDVEVLDVTFGSVPSGGEHDLTMTVHYDRAGQPSAAPGTPAVTPRW